MSQIEILTPKIRQRTDGQPGHETITPTLEGLNRVRRYDPDNQCEVTIFREDVIGAPIANDWKDPDLFLPVIILDEGFYPRA